MLPGTLSAGGCPRVPLASPLEQFGMVQDSVTPPSIATRAALGAGWVIAWRVATRNLGLISTLVLVRLLQPADFGLVALATGFINSVDALSALGIQDSLVRDPSPDRDAYDTAFTLGVVRALVTASLIALMAFPLGSFFDDNRLGIVMLALAAGTLISGFESIGTVKFRRNLAFRSEFDLLVRSRLCGVVSTILVAAIWHSYWALVAGILVNRSVRLVQSYRIAPERIRFTLTAWRRLIGFSLWSWAGALATQVRDRSDSVVIGRLLGTGAVGVFSAGLELGHLATTELVEPLNRVLFPGFASLHAGGERLKSMFLGAVGLGLLLLLPAGVGISIVADPMVTLALGAQWTGAIPVTEIVGLASVGSLFSSLSGTLLSAVGLPSMSFYLLLISTAVRILCLLSLMPAFGITGAAIGLLAAAVVESSIALWVTLPRIGVSARELARVAVRPTLASCAMAFLLWQIGMAWTPVPPGTAVVQEAFARCGLGAVVYATVLIGCWLVAGRPDGAERHVLRLATHVVNRIGPRLPFGRGRKLGDALAGRADR